MELYGPKISDQAFFAELDDTIPPLREIREIADKGDFPAAKKAFAQYIRKTLSPAEFFQIDYIEGENVFTYPDESELAAAERILNHELISCGTPHQFGETVDWFLNPTFNGFREWTWQLSRHHEWKLLAHAYRETKDERYAEGFVELFQSWVRQAVVPEPVEGYATLCWRTIEAGIRMGHSWPYALHAFYNAPAFTDEVLVDWYKSLWEHGWRLFHQCTRANWLIMEMNGLGQIGVLYPVFRDSKKWLQFAFDTLEKELDKQIYADGFQYELSTNYHDVVLRNYIILIEVCKQYDVTIPPSFLSKLENACTVFCKLAMPNGHLPDLNDGRWDKAGGYLKRYYKFYPHRKDFLWFATDKAEGTPPDYSSIALPYAGFLVMRTGWAETDTWALLDAGPFGRAHQHEDKLNFLLYGEGQLLLTEGGNYAYDSSEARKYVLSTRGHNTIRVDGLDQNRRSSYNWQDEQITEEAGMKYGITENYDHAMGSYNEGWGAEETANVTHSRHVIFMKKSPKALTPFFILVDRLTAKDGETHRYETLWHPNEASVRVTAHCLHTPKLSMLYAKEAKPEMQVVVGQESPEWQGFKIVSQLQGGYEPAPVASCIFQGGDLRTVCVIYLGENCPIVDVEAGSALTDQDITLLFADGSSWTIQEDSL